MLLTRNSIRLLSISAIACLMLGAGVDYSLNLPKGFPIPDIPLDNKLTEDRVALGRKLFFDNILSLDSSKSCSSCHIPALAFTDGKKVSEGIKGRKVVRNSSSLANVAYMKGLMRDGGIPTLEMQVEAPVEEHAELDFSLEFIALRMMKVPEYVKMSEIAYGRAPDPFVVTRALAAFERTLISGNSPFDQHFYQHKETLDPDQLKGYEVFKKKGCENCHSGFLFTDQSFHNTGLYLHYPDSGKMRISHLARDRALFRVPSLRNVAITAPYMHDGSLATLHDVIEHYRSGGEPHHNRSDMIGPLDISETEERQMISFLKSLTDIDFISNPDHGPFKKTTTKN